MIAEVDRTEWEQIHKYTGLSPEHLESIAQMFLDAKTAIFCWGWELLNIVTVQPIFIC